jgi:dihydropteroate synthase
MKKTNFRPYKAELRSMEKELDRVLGIINEMKQYVKYQKSLKRHYKTKGLNEFVTMLEDYYNDARSAVATAKFQIFLIQRREKKELIEREDWLKL